MSSSKTGNYQLPSWEKDDFIKMDDFNELTAKLDTVLKANADAAAQSVSAEQTARQNAITAEEQARANALDALRVALSAAIGAGGHTCRITHGTYTGTGEHGAKHPVELSFGFYPLLVLVQEDEMSEPLHMLRRSDSLTRQKDFSTSASTLTIDWNALGLSWYTTTAGQDAVQAAYQGNTSGTVYYYVAFGFDNSTDETD